ncbi:hypothetical protein FSZ31_05080 [Sphingorhabdus soli]|uniref:DUF1311 domain-containing protein n=1 Tax=Flavisphingopyxis soli TaxID=2601267 RepID=A0A5C6ULG1_9SPHN|nr:hypothetical protein [Sphingorhabdus soli]TXC74092.1 hypothetical protein FSZ31_05080 [Sphingorhabdus soli]
MSHALLATIAIIAAAGGMTAQSQPSRHQPEAQAAEYSAKQCEQAKNWLVETEGRGGDTADNQKQYGIWSSPACVAHRRPRQLDVTPQMRKTIAMLKENGIDIEARMPAKVAECRAKAPGALLALPASERATMTVDEVAATCVLNARTDLYAEALNELNADRQSQYARKEAEYERLKQERDDKLAENARIEKEQAEKLAAYKADYERKMEEWRTAVALCKKGKREYCAK